MRDFAFYYLGFCVPFPHFYARLIGWVRIIAANARTAAVCFRAGVSLEFHAAPFTRGMDGCVLLAAVFA